MIEQVHQIAQRQKANIDLVFADCAQNMVEEENNNEGAEDTDDDCYSNDDSSHESEDEWEDYDAGTEEQQVPAGISGVH